MALAPTRGGLFAATIPSALQAPVLPLFTALPYLQPGAAGSTLKDGSESIVIAWQTNSVPAEFTLEYGSSSALESKAVITRTKRLNGDSEDDSLRVNYAATLAALKLNTRYRYRVRMNNSILLEGYFTTRKPRRVKSRFVAFGDNSYGEISDRAIAYQAYRARPDFVMNTGDNVYENGLDNEYARYFFSVYNADVSGPRIGAPLLRSIPFYSVIANHDVHDKGPDKGPAANFDLHKDSLAFFTNFHFPLNGPTPAHPTPTTGDAEAIAHFAACAGQRFPGMANYSFDYADAHFLCLDSNVYVDPTAQAFQSWISEDLHATDAAWKFVVYHHPAFNAGFNHFSEQHMRALSPLFEQNGVDVILHGHEHTYQRTRPLRFAPTDLTGAKAVPKKNRLVPGKFTVDRSFDGKKFTKPNGILYIVTGAGGKHLYDPESHDNPTNWLHSEDDNADYVARFVSDRHSLTVFDIDRVSLRLTQIDEWGNEIDHCRITKG
jgi:hypothetical protein